MLMVFSDDLSLGGAPIGALTARAKNGACIGATAWAVAHFCRKACSPTFNRDLSGSRRSLMEPDACTVRSVTDGNSVFGDKDGPGPTVMAADTLEGDTVRNAAD